MMIAPGVGLKEKVRDLAGPRMQHYRKRGATTDELGFEQ
jgi:hypothetical protein